MKNDRMSDEELNVFWEEIVEKSEDEPNFPMFAMTKIYMETQRTREAEKELEKQVKKLSESIDIFGADLTLIIGRCTQLEKENYELKIESRANAQTANHWKKQAEHAIKLKCEFDEENVELKDKISWLENHINKHPGKSNKPKCSICGKPDGFLGVHLCSEPAE